MTGVSPFNQYQNYNWQSQNNFGTGFNNAWNANSFSSPMFGAGGWSPYTAFGWGGMITSSSTSSSTKSIEDVEKQKKENIKKKDVLFKQKEQILLQKEEVDKLQADFDKTKNADGTAKKVEKLENMSLWSKLGRGAMNAFNGLGNLCKSLVGYDENGKWDPMKCIRNVAIAAAATAVCVFAAPVAVSVATALGASASTAAMAGAVAKGVLVTAPAVGALVGGVAKTGKGLYDACTADTTEQFDRATESVGQGVAITIAARAGLKSISSSAGLASSGLKGTFVNPFKAGYLEAQAAYSNIASTATSAGLSSAKDLTFLKSVSAGRSGIKNFHADIKMDAFKKNLAKTRKSLAKEALEARKLVQSTTDPRAKALFEMQRDHALKCMSDLKRVKNTTDLKAVLDATKNFEKLAKPQHRWSRSGSSFEINGFKYTKAELEKCLGNSYKLNDAVNSLAKDQFKVMSNVAGSTKYADVVDDFGMSNKWYAQPYNWAMAKYNQGITKGDIFFGAMTLSAPVYALDPLLRNPMMTANNIAILADPSYEEMQAERLSKEEVDAEDQKFAQAKEQLDKNIKDIDKQMKALS